MDAGIAAVGVSALNSSTDLTAYAASVSSVAPRCADDRATLSIKHLATKSHAWVETYPVLGYKPGAWECFRPDTLFLGLPLRKL